jgi:hypothetical protein
MTQPRDLDPIIATWLDDGPIELPDATRRAITVGLRSQPRARRMAILRGSIMLPINRFAAAAAILVAVGAFSVFLLANRSGQGVGAAPTPSVAAPTSSPSSGLSPSQPAASGSIALFSDGSLTTDSSTRYGFSIAHPADWTETHSDHVWTLPADVDWKSTAPELFMAPGDAVRVTAWSVPVSPGTTADSWLQSYCPLNTTPCSGLGPLTVPVTMDGHPGSLVRFKDDTQAFVVVGNRLYVVAVWEPDTDPRTAPYGGAVQLLKDYLSTVRLLPGGPVEAAVSPGPS